MPNSQSIESDDGSRSLSHAGISGGSMQAGGGAIYKLRISRLGKVTEICGVVQSTTSFYFDKYAKAAGIDLDGMGLAERRPYFDDYLQNYGHNYSIVDFYYADEHRDARHRAIDNVSESRDIFCKMLLRLKSSFRFNNSEYPECGEGCYHDELQFEPWRNYREYFKTFRAAETLDR